MTDQPTPTERLLHQQTLDHLANVEAENQRLQAHVAACRAMHDADQEEVQRLREGRPLEVVEADVAVQNLRLQAENERLRQLHREDCEFCSDEESKRHALEAEVERLRGEAEHAARVTNAMDATDDDLRDEIGALRSRLRAREDTLELRWQDVERLEAEVERLRADVLREVGNECAVEHEGSGYVTVQMSLATWREIAAVLDGDTPRDEPT